MAADQFSPFPPSARQIGSAGRFDSLAWDGADLLWCLTRSGQGALYRAPSGQNGSVISQGLNIGGRVHYGGGEFSARAGRAAAAARDGGLYVLEADAPPERIPAPPGACAAPVISPSGQQIAFVHSDGRQDSLMLWTAGQPIAAVVDDASDFYTQPAWNPTEDRLAWVEWRYPNLPWIHTRLVMKRFHPHDSPQPVILRDEADSVFQQPEFSPDGRWLACLRSHPNGDSIELLDLSNERWRTLTGGPGLVLALPAWLQGQRTLVWSADSQSLVYLRFQQTRAEIWQVWIASGSTRMIPDGGYTWFQQPCINPEGRLAVLASAADTPAVILLRGAQTWQVAARADPPPPPGIFPQPRPLNFPGSHGETVYATYYPPVPGRGDGPPPAIVHLHSGPTRLAGLEYDPEILFFTSRGFGWLSVNYRGSAGFGRAYQQALHGRWGVADVADAAAAVAALCRSGLADPQRLALYGSSAGGFTVLNTLIEHPHLVRAAVCKYPVSDLLRLNETTHKFEQHYNDWLLGRLPEAEDLYRQRSPLFRAAAIRTPLALFHGEADPVVPPAQSQQIAEAVRAAGGICELTIYPAEGHGFRQAGTLENFYDQMLGFLRRQGVMEG